MAEPSGGRDSGLPEKFGRYRILRMIDRGAMGVVYAAEDEVMGRTVALKILVADLESDPETRTRFGREAQAAARLVHPNIITIFDAGTEHGRSYIAMQLLVGMPLGKYLTLPESAALERKLDLMIQMCEGLAAAHSEGIIHRDLKPNNLFVQSDGLLKILDFGVARLADSRMTMVGEMLGTPDYMSPEQARGDAVDGRSDIFSMGAVFYVMLAGRKPFAGPDLPSVLRQLQVEEPAPLPGEIPADLGAIVAGAMAKHVDDRPARVQDLVARLVRFRRQYQAETRRLATAARSQFESLETLVAAVREAGKALSIPDGNDVSSDELARRFPQFSARGAGGSDGLQPDRSAVTVTLSALETERARLNAELAARQGYVAEIEAGEGALAEGDAISALRHFEHVAAAAPQAIRASDRAAAIREQARAQRARDERLAELVAAARVAVQTQQWTAAIERSREALALVANHSPAESLLAEAMRGLTAETERRAAAGRMLEAQVRTAIDRAEFDVAHDLLRQFDDLDAGVAAATGLRQRLVEARAAAEALALLREVTAEEIRQARGAFRRGRYDEAIQSLGAFLEVEPAARDAEVELDRLIELREVLVSDAATRRALARQILGSAKPVVERGALSDALGLARQAVSSDPSDQEAVAFLDDLLERELRQRVAAERARAASLRQAEVERILTAARAAEERGYLAVALDYAMSAKLLAPDRDETTALIGRLRATMASEDQTTFVLADGLGGETSPQPRVSDSMTALPRPDQVPVGTQPASVTAPSLWDHASGWLKKNVRKS